ncbi:MAG: DUF503 domain-containing protein [Candidatus Loosdrechtia sp.]|uniref:DUF503 domain-containing protein n=1 Tax=Candidatus Loosdrechtia sp. TaxID=3101272 RepID=UPI003A715C2C|nr:MAG: DUF503 domain-containing protein [Candidatus Jettenia sp. AMX2]
MNLEFSESDNAVVGFLHIRLVMRSAGTLKDKRRIIKSLKDRLQNRFNISIAEIGSLDHCQYSELGIVMVGNDNRYVNGVLSNVIKIIRCVALVELVDYKLEFL